MQNNWFEFSRFDFERSRIQRETQTRGLRPALGHTEGFVVLLAAGRQICAGPEQHRQKVCEQDVFQRQEQEKP